jgi:hypothetical protein
MEATIIRLDKSNANLNSGMVVRTASFEEAFGDFSEAKGKGRARRKKRKLERVANKREVRTERRKLKSDRQEERLDRRKTRKERRQDMRNEQQEARMGRRTRRQDMRQQRTEARNTRKMTNEQGEQERENYALEQELERDNLTPQDEQGYYDEEVGYSDEQSGGYSDEQSGGYSDEQGGGYSDEQGGGGYYEQGSDDWASAPQGYYDEEVGYSDEEEGAYGDDNRYDSPYVQEETEFADDSYFNVEGMANNNIVPPAVADKVTKLKNNERAYKDLTAKRNEMAKVGNNTTGVDIQIKKCYGRICELREELDTFANADGNRMESKKRRRAIGMAMGLKKRRRQRGAFGGSEVPVKSELNPEFSPNRIEIPATSNFDAYSDLGRPVIVDAVTQSDYADYSSDLLTDSAEPTTIDLFSNFDGGEKTNTKALVSVVIGIGVGALAIYVAKKKGWI